MIAKASLFFTCLLTAGFLKTDFIIRGLLVTAFLTKQMVLSLFALKIRPSYTVALTFGVGVFLKHPP